jgi:D-alanyl-D-alanine carboxypeptidase
VNRPLSTLSLRRRASAVAAAALAALVGFAGIAAATPTAGAYLVFDARTGEVIARHNADQAWYPASVTKLTTTWVTLQAIRAGRIRLTSPVPMTATAARQPPSKMGFKVGEVVTVDNALKIIMVKSANDVAWALAEAVGGSKPAFVAEMNRQARLLGMRSTRWDNPNGLPDPDQVSTARDLGLLARALLTEFPEASGLWHLPGIQIGDQVIRNHNHLLDRFPGANGMKTGFICSSGFNVVASATRGNRKLVAVVLGSRNTRQRAELAAELFTKGFENGGGGLFGRFSAAETIDHMARGPEAGDPVKDMKSVICGKKRDHTPDPEDIGETRPTSAGREQSAVIRPGEPGWLPAKRETYLTERFDIGPPVRVWVGGADAAPSDAGSMLALVPATNPAALMAAPTFSTASAPLPTAAPGAIRPRIPGDQPPTGPASGAGLGATLAPANGAPLVITAPGAAPSTVLSAVDRSRPTARPAAAASTSRAVTREKKPARDKKAQAEAPAKTKSAKATARPAGVPMPTAKPRPRSGG